MIIGERLADLRKDKGWSQKELASALGISEKSISLYERNRNVPNDDIKIKIAKVFNVSLDYLAGLINDEVPYSREHYIVLPRDYPPLLKEEMTKQLELLKNTYMK